MNHPIIYTAVMTLAGIGIPVMATLSARLGKEVASPILAAGIMFLTGFVCSVIALLATGMPTSPASSLPWYYYAAGALMAFYAISIIFVAPHFGMANAIFCVLLGQIIASIIIDHFALFGLEQSPITLQRALGVACMVIGIILARKTS